MAVQPEPSRLSAVYFWRWLLAGTLLVAVIGTLEYIDVSLLQVDLAGSARRDDQFRLGLTLQLIDFVFGLAYPAYALVFFGNYFFLQRFERVAGWRLASLWLLGAAVLTAGLAASWLVALLGGGLLIGLGFGALLWLLQKFHSAVFRFPPPRLLRAHLLGGFIAGVVLSLRGVAFTGVFFSARLPVPAAPAVLALAFVPHLLLTWRAMRPALAANPKAPTSNPVFICRLLAAIVALVAIALLGSVLLRH